MEFIVVKANITGIIEHDKYAIEIARKNKHLEKIYEELEACIENIHANCGYSEVSDMVSELKKVKIEIALISQEMQNVMNKLDS